MTEDRFEEFLREGLADYNRPPEPPTEALWTRIEAARAELRAQHASPRRGRILPLWAQWAVGLAATLMVGIALGRLSLDRPSRSSAPDTVAAVRPGPAASGPVAAAPTPSTDTQQAAPNADTDHRLASAAGQSVRGVAGRSEAASAAAASPLDEVAGAAAPPPGRPRVEGGGRAGGTAAGYRLAALHTFGQAEALLTAVRTAPDDSVDYQQLSDWARDLLASTRLLLDSPAGRDPAMARLLSDLELVLVQVAGLADDRDAGRELIQGALQQRDVLPRLRAAVPAGSTIGT